jgi:hypothetical protein
LCSTFPCTSYLYVVLVVLFLHVLLFPEGACYDGLHLSNHLKMIVWIETEYHRNNISFI